MKPKQFIRYTRMLDKKGLAVCDGISENLDMFSLLYPLFALTGISFFLWLLNRWIFLKEKIKDGENVKKDK